MTPTTSPTPTPSLVKTSLRGGEKRVGRQKALRTIARTSLPLMRNPGNKAGSARARDSGIGDCPRFHRSSLLLWCKLRPLLLFNIWLRK